MGSTCHQLFPPTRRFLLLFSLSESDVECGKEGEELKEIKKFASPLLLIRRRESLRL